MANKKAASIIFNAENKARIEQLLNSVQDGAEEGVIDYWDIEAVLDRITQRYRGVKSHMKGIEIIIDCHAYKREDVPHWYRYWHPDAKTTLVRARHDGRAWRITDIYREAPRYEYDVMIVQRDARWGLADYGEIVRE